jgi:hypothetical protein
MPIKNEKIVREIKNVQSAGKRQKSVKNCAHFLTNLTILFLSLRAASPAVKLCEKTATPHGERDRERSRGRAIVLASWTVLRRRFLAQSNGGRRGTVPLARTVVRQQFSAKKPAVDVPE